MDDFGFVDSFAEDEGFLVYSSETKHNLLHGEKGEDHHTRTDTKVFEKSPVFSGDSLVFYFGDEFLDIRNFMGKLTVFVKNAFVGRKECQVTELTLRLLRLRQLADLEAIEFQVFKILVDEAVSQVFLIGALSVKVILLLKLIDLVTAAHSRIGMVPHLIVIIVVASIIVRPNNILLVEASSG